jgi:hypothetical protein
MLANPTLDKALAYWRAGLSVIPIKRDGSKAPDGSLLPEIEKDGEMVRSWDPFKESLPTREDLDCWYGTSRPSGIAVVGGKVSGNLETIDVDDGTLFEPWCAIVEAECPGLTSRLSIAATPRNPAGYHVRYRCETLIPGNLKLAQKLVEDPKTSKPKKKTLIETRGEGGYSLVPGCPPDCHETCLPYKHHAGPELSQVLTIPWQERDILIRAAKSFHQIGEESTHAPRRAGGNGWLRPGDDYNRRGPAFLEIMEPHGWAQVSVVGGVTRLRRPGKDKGWSATAGYCTSKEGIALLYVFSSNAAPFESDNCYSRFTVYTLLNHGGDFKAASRALASQGYGGGPITPGGPQAGGDRSAIVITTEEHKVNDQGVVALARDSDVYQRGGLLVRIVRDSSPAAKGVRRPLAPRIEPLPLPLLRERLAANSRWATVDNKPARPPGWCVSAVHARAEWPGVRHLEAVVDYPVLRPDGTILTQPGYDPDTGLLLMPAGPIPEVPGAPTRQEARDAWRSLAEVIADFPFEDEVHRAGWLAALLTPLARFAFAGPGPLFLVDSNVRGAGKGLLLDCISRIVTGERFTVAAYTSDEDELRKRITSLALAGNRLVLFDNLEGNFGNAVLDAALTATAWKDRILGGNRMAEVPLFMTWYATGNNVAVAADTARRVCHIRLESPEERPEERNGFRFPNLLAWVGVNRGRLLSAALTILRTYFEAGHPDMGLPAWGSYEGWSAVVRSAVVWVGLPDPGETRLLLQESGDVTAECMRVLLECWVKMDPGRHGVTAAEVIHRLYKKPPSPVPDYHADMKDALEALLSRPDARGLGTKLRSYRRRVFGGLFFDHAGTLSRAVRWAVFPARDFRRWSKNPRSGGSVGSECGECGECGECIPAGVEIDPGGGNRGDSWEHPADRLVGEFGNRPPAEKHSPHSPHSHGGGTPNPESGSGQGTGSPVSPLVGSDNGFFPGQSSGPYPRRD